MFLVLGDWSMASRSRDFERLTMAATCHPPRGGAVLDERVIPVSRQGRMGSTEVARRSVNVK